MHTYMFRFISNNSLKDSQAKYLGSGNRIKLFKFCSEARKTFRILKCIPLGISVSNLRLFRFRIISSKIIILKRNKRNVCVKYVHTSN